MVDEEKTKKRGRGRKVWRAIRRALPALWRAIAASSDELIEALADGRITGPEAVEIGIAFGSALADESTED